MKHQRQKTNNKPYIPRNKKQNQYKRQKIHKQHNSIKLRQKVHIFTHNIPYKHLSYHLVNNSFHTYYFFIMNKPKKKVNLPPTTYVKKGSRPSVAPQQFTSTFDGISKNPVSPLVSSFTPSVEPPKLNQNIISHDIVTHRPSNGGTTRFRIPSYPRKRATPKPAFGRFVPPTGGSKKLHNTTLMKISPQ